MRIVTARDSKIANAPGPFDPVPWYMRYTLPVAAAAGVFLYLFFDWLATL